MAVYAIISEDAQPQLLGNIDQAYKGRTYQFSDAVVLISTPDAPRDIAAKVGVQHRTADGTIVSGLSNVMITKLSPTYYGWANNAVWEWLKTAHQEDGG